MRIENMESMMSTIESGTTKQMKSTQALLCLLCFILAGVFLLSAGCARPSREKTRQPAATVAAAPEAIVHRPDVSLMRPDGAGMAPGLAVIYFFKKMRHIDEMPKGDEITREGRPGKPVLFLNHRFDKGVVFDSGKKQAVGMRMSGFIRFAQAGRYYLQANSNDGIRIFVAEKMIVDDPKVHADRLTVPGIVIIDKPGWYPVLIQYFQRKGTATLQLFWKVPGSDEYRILPAAVYAHLP